MKKQYCVKKINDKCYLYKWQYIPIHSRNRRKPKKFKWTYIGAENSQKTKRLLRRSEELKAIILELFEQAKHK